MVERVAIITGAGRGIGKHLAKKLAKEGIIVIMTARTQDEIEKVSREIDNEGGKSLALTSDISKVDDVKRLVETVIKKFSKIDILVNNAGIIGPIGPIENIDINEWETNIKNNLFGTFHCIRTILPHMIAKQYGRIINLSGGGAFNPSPNFSAYSSSKAAIIRLTETIAMEVDKYNITINAISPGAIKTNMTEEIAQSGNLAGSELEKAKKVIEDGGSSLEDVAKLVLFLISDEANELSGKSISARWDDLNYIKKNISKIQKSDKYTMRRIT